MAAKKEKPIPTKFDGATKDGIKELGRRTGMKDSELIRRLVDFSLGVVETTGRTDFLFDDKVEAAVRDALAHASDSATRESLKKK